MVPVLHRGAPWGIRVAVLVAVLVSVAGDDVSAHADESNAQVYMYIDCGFECDVGADETFLPVKLSSRPAAPVTVVVRAGAAKMSGEASAAKYFGDICQGQTNLAMCVSQQAVRITQQLGAAGETFT